MSYPPFTRICRTADLKPPLMCLLIPMSWFIKSMGVFWTLAEIVIIAFLRKGFSELRSSSNSSVFGAGLILISISTAAVMFGADPIFRLIISDPSNQRHLLFFRKALWNFFCTLWVVLEGVIFLYVLNLYGILKTALHQNSGVRGYESAFRWGIPLFFLMFFFLFFFYEYALWQFIDSSRCDLMSIHRISVFYIKLCGLFWIIFDGGVAAVGFLTFRLLYQHPNKFHSVIALSFLVPAVYERIV